MTREEAIRIFRKEIECLSHTKCEDCILEKACDPMNTTPYDSEYIEAYSMAIKALEQEPFINKPCVSSGVCEHDKQKVFDKIRAEIEGLQTYKLFSGDAELYLSMDDVLAILDKKISELEGKEWIQL